MAFGRLGALGRGYGRMGGGGVVSNDPLVTLSSTSIEWDAEAGDLIGTLGVANQPDDWGTTTFSITSDPDNKLQLDGGDNTLLEVEATVDYDTASSHPGQITATPSGPYDPITRNFTFPVIAYVPDVFGVGDWSVAGDDEEAAVTIDSLPADNGTDITDIEYRVDGGSWVSSGGVVSFSITGLTNGVEYDVQLRAVNATSNGPASDTKQVTPAAAAGSSLDFSDPDNSQFIPMV